MTDLLSWKPPITSYPYTSGYKENTTSRDAAEAIDASGRADNLRNECYAQLVIPRTAKELAFAMREEITSIRPRLSELKQRGLIIESGIRRDKQHVWKRVRGGENG